MKSDTIHIRNMCCSRCIKVVTDELKNLGLNVSMVDLGHATFLSNPEITSGIISDMLQKNGFELIESDEEKLVEQIKHIIYDLIQNNHEKLSELNFPKYIAEKTGRQYRLLSRIFSENKKMTIQHYIILEKIEKVKELLEYGKMNLNEITDYMGYKTPQHLSSQFRAITGKSAIQYQRMKSKTRRGIDRI